MVLLPVHECVRCCRARKTHAARLLKLAARLRLQLGHADHRRQLLLLRLLRLGSVAAVAVNLLCVRAGRNNDGRLVGRLVEGVEFRERAMV